MKHVFSDRYLRVMARLDRLIAALVLLFAFVLAAFPARNSEVWMRLASGRLLAHLDYSFGHDPFNFTTDGLYWANHGWLFDGGLYLATALGGPEGLGGTLAIILKGLAAAGLAWLMIQIHRRPQSLWAPACTTLLALLVLSPGLELRPMLASLILLALTLAILFREGKPPDQPEKKWAFLWSSSPRRLYALPVVFILWVNLDGWFWLGPACVALFLLGDWLQERWSPFFSGREASDPAERPTLAKVLGLGLLACLISPHHVHALLTLPPELGAASRFAPLQADPFFRSYFTGPFDSAYFVPELGMNVAGLAYYFLLALGLGSMFLSFRWWRLVLFVAFAILSLLSMRLIPFFAVVTGPIIALNIHDLVEAEGVARLAHEVRLRRTALVGRGITLQTLAVFLVLAWAGWLHAPSAQRRLGFAIAADPSLKGAAEQLRRQGQGSQGASASPGEGVNVHPGLADYLAWFSPGYRSYFDQRLVLMGQSMAGYAALQSQLGVGGRRPESVESVWQSIRRRWAADSMLLYAPSAAQSAGLFSRLVQDGQHWTLVWLDGRASAFAWHDSASPAQPAWRLDPLAFGPDVQHAPLSGPDRDPGINYLEHFLFGAPPRPLDADLAEMYVVYYQAAGRREHDRRLAAWFAGPLADQVGAGASRMTLVDGVGRITLPLLAVQGGEEMRKTRFQDADLGPPAAPILSIRAARRASAENPDDADAYLFLGQAYDLIWRLQENHWAGIRSYDTLTPMQLLRFLNQPDAPTPYSPWIARTLDHRQLLRQAQLAAALKQHLIGDPDSDFTHRTLYELFWKMNYYDAAIDHLRAEVEILRRRVGQRDPKLVQVRASFLEEREREVELLRSRYQRSGTNGQFAFRPFGLANEAIKQIRQGPGVLNAADVDLYLYLLLTTGRSSELATALAENQALPTLIGPRFHWYQGMLAATRGNYQEADKHFEQTLKALPPLQPPLANLLQSLTADPPGLGRAATRPILRELGTRSAAAISSIVQETAELQLLRGLLAIEVGDTAAARQHLEQSLRTAGPEAAPAKVSRRYLGFLKAEGKPGQAMRLD